MKNPRSLRHSAIKTILKSEDYLYIDRTPIDGKKLKWLRVFLVEGIYNLVVFGKDPESPFGVKKIFERTFRKQ